MKKLQFLYVFVLLICLTACNNEPLEDDFLDESSFSCAEASQGVLTAATNFSAATSETYSALCSAYRTALQVQITACGDSSGAVQQIIDSLGDCIQVVDPCELATELADQAEVTFNAATIENYESVCNAYRLALVNKIGACGDDDGSIQQIIDSLGDCIQNLDPCEFATQVADEAEIALNSATSETYEAACNAYRVALLNKIDACGDGNGSIQMIIDDLGDCLEPGLDIEISLSAGTLDVEFDMVVVNVNGATLEVTGTSSASTSYMIYFEVADLDTGDDIIQNFVLTLTSEFTPSDLGPEPFTSNIAMNNQGVLEGTFSGLVTNSDNADLNLTNGVIDINY